MKFHITLAVIVMMLITSGMAIAIEDYGHIGGEWGYGSSPFLNVEYTNETQSFSIASVGKSNRYPTVCDLDNDDNKEIIAYAGQSIIVYDYNPAGYTLTAQKDIGEAVLGVACVPSPEGSPTDRKQILAFGEDNVIEYELSGSTLTADDTIKTFASTLTAISQPHCTEYFNSGLAINDYSCVIGTGTEFHIVTSGNTDSNINYTSTHDVTKNVIYDRLNDVVYSADTTHVYYNDVSTPGTPASMARQTLYTAGADLQSPGVLVSYNDVFVGEYVCTAYEDTGNTAGTYDSGETLPVCFNNIVDLGLSATDPVNPGSSAPTSTVSQAVFYDIDFDGDIDICIAHAGTGVYGITCRDMNNNLNRGLTENIGVTMNAIGNFRDIDNPHVMMGNKVISWDDYSDFEYLTRTGNVVAVDIDGDNTQEIIEVTSSVINIFGNVYEYTDNVTIINTNDYNGLYGFIDPTCTDTNFSIRAKECVSSTSSCTYFNANPDEYVQERLCTTCAGTVPERCGAWSYTNPEVWCQFNTTGTKNIDVDLYTSTNSETVALEFEMSIVVSDTDCDDVDDFVSVPAQPDTETPVEDDDQDELDPVEYYDEDNVIRIVLMAISIGITLVVIISLATAKIDHPLPYMLVIFGCITIFTLANWIPIQWGITFIIGSIILGIVSFLMHRARFG